MMSGINSYVQPTANLVQIDLTNVSTAGNTNLVTAQNNAYGVPYLTNSIQAYTVFSVYICVDSAVSLIVQRYVVGIATILDQEVFPVETANQPAWHSFPVSQFERVSLMLSGPANITKLTVLEPKYVK
jgi:hypothetical protein